MVSSLNGVSACIEEIVNQAAGRLEDLLEAILEAIFQEVPDYASLPEDHRTKHRADLRAMVELVLEVLKGRQILPEEHQAIVEIGRKRAEQGMPLDSVLKSVGVAMNEGFYQLAAEAVQRSPGLLTLQAVGLMAGELVACVDSIRGDLTKGAMEYRTALPTRETLIERTVNSLLAGAFESDKEIADKALAAGVDLRPPFGVFLIATGDGDESKIGKAIGQLLQRVPGALATGEAVLIPCRTDGSWGPVLAAARGVAEKCSVTILCTRPVSEARLIHRAYRQACNRLALAARVSPPPSVIFASDLDVHSLLDGSDPNESTEFVQRVLGPILDLPEPKRSDYLGTLEALYRCNGGQKEAAAHIHTHVNTVKRRVRQIREITQRSLDSSESQLETYIALHLLRLSVSQRDTSKAKV
jgi:hypothetical protein